MTSLYLASGSPRRRELLTLLGVSFDILLTHTEEQRREGEAAEAYVRRGGGKALEMIDMHGGDLFSEE